MIYFIAGCLAAYIISAGVGFAAHFGGFLYHPWTRLRHLAGTACAILLVTSIAGWAGFLPGSPSPPAQANSLDPPPADFLDQRQAKLLDSQKMEAAILFAKKERDELLPAPSAPQMAIDPDAGPISFEEPSIHWYIQYYSALHGVDPLLVQAVVRVESNFDPNARSRTGAMGLMQINKITAKHLGMKNPYDVRENLEAGTRYLKSLLKRHYWDLHLALASYNAGPTAVEQFGGIPPYPETKRYVWKVIDEFRNLKLVAAAFKEKKSRQSRSIRLSARRGTKSLEPKSSPSVFPGQGRSKEISVHASSSSPGGSDSRLNN